MLEIQKLSIFSILYVKYSLYWFSEMKTYYLFFVIYLKTLSVRRFFKRRNLLLLSYNRLQVTCKKGRGLFCVIIPEFDWKYWWKLPEDPGQ